DLSGLLTLGCDGTRRGLCDLESSSFPLQSRVAYGCRHLRDEPLEQLDVLVPVIAAVGHQLHDTDDLTLVLDRHHHGRARGGFAGVRNPPDSAFAIDVGVRAFVLSYLLRDVAEEVRVAADDH